jgi:hypothetical protein
MYIARARQEGQTVLGYDEEGAVRYVLPGHLVEFARDWIAIRCRDKVLVYHTRGSGVQTFLLSIWAKGARPKGRWFLR